MSKERKKWFSRENLLILVLGGILLLVISLPIGEPNESVKRQEVGQNADPKAPKTGEMQNYDQNTDANEIYVHNLEQRLTDSLSKMANVGRVQVLITLKSSEELIVEKEQPVSRATTNEQDSTGGSREVDEMMYEENTIYRTNGGSNEPYVVKTIVPTIEGVLVVAEGAGSGNVSRTIVEIVQALFGVDAHKVQVVKMENKK